MLGSAAVIPNSLKNLEKKLQKVVSREFMSDQGIALKTNSTKPQHRTLPPNCSKTTLWTASNDIMSWYEKWEDQVPLQRTGDNEILLKEKNSDDWITSKDHKRRLLTETGCLPSKTEEKNDTNRTVTQIREEECLEYRMQKFSFFTAARK